MPTSQRRRRSWDVERIAEAVSRPGIDPRTWGSSSRIDDDPEALNYLPSSGWVVDVTFHGSDLDGQNQVPARVINLGPPGDGYGEYIPPDPDCEAAVLVPGGDPENGPIVLGYLTNEDGCAPPAEINQIPIDAEAESSSGSAVSPYDTEFKRSPHHRREEYALDRYVQARNHVIEAAEQVKLALRDPQQSFLRSEAFTDSLQGWVDAVTEFVTANATADLKVYAAVNGLAPGSILPNEIKAVADAAVEVPAAKAAYEATLTEGESFSAKIKGD